MINRFFRKDLEEKVETLETKIADLKKENEKLRKRLSKRDERKESEPARFQETAEELKRAKISIESLEDQISALKAEKENSLKNNSAEDFYISKNRSLGLLEKLASVRAQKDNLISVYLPPGETFPEIYDRDKTISGYLENIRSETGIIGFFDLDSPSLAYFFTASPFPFTKVSISKKDRFDTDQAAEIFLKERHAAFILGHAGESYIGVANESGLIKGELVRSSVKEKHSKGGWSQKRFERLREEDIKHHTDKAGEIFSGLLEDYKDIVDIIVISGDRKTGMDIAGKSNIPVIYRQSDTKPDRHAGEKLAKELWSARWYRV